MFKPGDIVYYRRHPDKILRYVVSILNADQVELFSLSDDDDFVFHEFSDQYVLVTSILRTDV